MGRSLTREVWFQAGQNLYCQKRKDAFKVRGPRWEYSLKVLETGRWKLSGKNTRGERRKPHFDALSIEDAIEKANRLLGFGETPQGSDLRINRVLGRWLDSRSIRQRTKSDYRSHIKVFLDWCEEQELSLWVELRLEHIEKYRNHLIERRKGWTPYHYLKVVRAASKWAARNWRGEFVDFCDGFILPKPSVQLLKEETNALTLDEVAEFCQWLNDHEEGSQILPVVALCGFCGLRVLEALRLPWSCVDLDSETLDITGEVKNPHSERRIPFPKIVGRLLSQMRQESGFVVSAFRDKDSYARVFRKLYDEWNPQHRIVPSDLRDVIQTLAEVEGWKGFVMDRYVGHAPQTMSQRHYTKRSSEALVEDMRVQVTSRIDAKLDDWGAKWPKNGPIDNVVPLRSVS